MAELNLQYTHRDMVAIAFWHNLDDGDALPVCVWNGLQSAAACGRFAAVYLFSYQTFRRLPPGVTSMSAEDILPHESFVVYLRGVESKLGKRAIAPLSDLVRLKACAETTHAFAVLMDCDTIWLRNMPVPDPQHVQYERSYGHLFASHRINKCSRKNTNLKQHMVERHLEYAMEYGDFLDILPPFLFCNSSLVAGDAVSALLTAIVDVVKEPPSTLPYNFAMRIVKSCINDHGCRGAIVEPRMFSPLEYWRRATVCLAADNGEYSAFIHQQRTVGVNCFFQSTNEANGPEMRGLTAMHPQSTWSKILAASETNGLSLMSNISASSTGTVGGTNIIASNIAVSLTDTVGSVALPSSMGAQALKAGSGTVELFLQVNDRLHLASVCKGLNA